MRGVRVTMMSVSCVSIRLWANSRPMIGRSLRPGMPSSTSRSSSRISPARMLVSPFRRRIVVVMDRSPNVGMFPYPTPDMLMTSMRSSSETSSLWWT